MMLRPPPMSSSLWSQTLRASLAPSTAQCRGLATTTPTRRPDTCTDGHHSSEHPHTHIADACRPRNPRQPGAATHWSGLRKDLPRASPQRPTADLASHFNTVTLSRAYSSWSPRGRHNNKGNRGGNQRGNQRGKQKKGKKDPLSDIDESKLDDWGRLELKLARDAIVEKKVKSKLKAASDWADWTREETTKVSASLGPSIGSKSNDKTEVRGRLGDRRLLDLIEICFDRPRGSIEDETSARRLLALHSCDKVLETGTQLEGQAKLAVSEAVALLGLPKTGAARRQNGGRATPGNAAARVLQVLKGAPRR